MNLPPSLNWRRYCKVQWDEAASQRATAQAESTARAEAQAKEQAQRQIALARNLAELSRKLGLPDSQIFVGRDAPNGNAQSTATLLAIESIKRNPTFEGVQALIAQLSHLPLVVTRKNFSTDGFVKPIETSENEEFAKIYINSDQTQVFKISQVTQTDYALYAWRTPGWQETGVTNISVPEETGLSYQPPVVISANTEWFSYVGRDGIVLQRTSNDFSQLVWKTSGPFSALQFSLDSKTLLASKQDGNIKVWSVDTQQEIATITALPGTNFVSFDGNGSLLIVETALIGKNRYDVYIYDIRSEKMLASFPNSSYLGSDDTANFIAISFGDRYEPDNIHIWDVSLKAETFVINNECLLNFIHGSENILTMSKGKDGSCLSGLGNPIHIWDIKKKQKIYELELDDLVWARAISPEGDMAAISTGETVYVIDITKMKILTQIALDFMADTFAFSPDRSVIMIANRSPLPVAGGKHSFNAIIWDLKNNVEIGRIPHDNFIISMTFYEDSRHIIIADNEGNLIAWDIKDLWKNKVFEFQHDQQAAFPGSVASGRTFAVPVFSSNGQQLAIGGGNGKVETFELLSNQKIFTYEPTDVAASGEIIYSPDGKWLAFTGLSCQLGSCPNNVKILDVKSNTLFTIDPMEPVSFSAEIVFSPDSRYLAINWRSEESQTNLVHIWDTDQWSRIKEVILDYSDAWSRSMTFSSTGDHLVIGSSGNNGKLLVLDTSSWKQTFEISSPTAPFAFFGGSNLLVASSYDSKNLKGVIRVINTDTWKEVTSFQYDSQVQAITFSSSGEYMCAIDSLHNLITWETYTGRTISIKFIPDIGGALIASPDHPSWFLVNAGNDILIVDVFTGTEIERIDTGEPISILDVSPDGHFIASGGADGKVQVWYWRPEDLISEACARLPRNLTRVEWKQYLGDEPYRATCPNLPIPTE